MAEVKWIKLYVDMFENRKIKQIETMPDADAILIFWLKLLTLTGKINDAGYVMFSEDFPYTDEMLSAEFGMPINTIRLALKTLETFRMIKVIDDAYYITNWDKYQSVDKLEEIRAKTRKRVAKYRKKQKQLESNANGNVTVTLRNAIEREIDKEEDIDIEKDKDIIDTNVSLSVETDAEDPRTLQKSDYDNVLDYWNKASMLKEITAITPKRQGHINSRYKEHGLKAIYDVIANCGKSTFMRGDNNRGWHATFDWVFLPNNFVKVLEGNYLPDKKGNEKSKMEMEYQKNLEEMERLGL